MSLRSPALIVKDLMKSLWKKFHKDKLYSLKVLMYVLYIYISGKKAVSCIRILIESLKKRNESVSFTMLSLLYMIFVIVQMILLCTSEMSCWYRKLKMKLKLIMYEMTFQNK